ncbi:MAG: LytR/AlgR family response regulator transcription factor [Burkholderiaceae bacterium]
MSHAPTANPRALIADDEPLLRASLRAELLRGWPELEVVAEVPDGNQALKGLSEPGLDIAFLDIQMPGLTGLQVANKLMSQWPAPTGSPSDKWPPLLVFVTAYGEFALEAFEGAAVDYVLKPVTPDRLVVTIKKLQARLQERQAAAGGFDQSALNALAQQLAQLSGHQTAGEKEADSSYLKTIRAAVGDTVRMIPVDEVLLLEAADKYVVVHTAEGESLIREPLRELLGQLDPARFQQVHRSTIVNMQAVKAATRDARGKLVLVLNGLTEKPAVSRHYAHLFKAM